MRKLFKKTVETIITWEARVALRRHRPRIVAVTGNVGKTSTKDAISAVLAHQYGAAAVRASAKSMNSEFGVPLTILGLDTAWSSVGGWLSNFRRGLSVAWGSSEVFPQWLVLEVGADHPGDIEKLARWLRPDIVVLTRMSDTPVHVEFFWDADEVLREKMFLAEALRPGGTLVVNADDERFQRAVREMDVKKILYGSTKGADAQIVESGTTYTPGNLPLPIGQYALVRMGEAEARIELSYVLGAHLVYPFAAACGVAMALGIQSSIPGAFADFKCAPGRMRSLKGLNSTAIIDDSYNSSPLACAEALRTVAGLSIRGRKIAALADMKELGGHSEVAHRDIGRLVAETLHTLVTVGELGRLIALGAREAGMAEDRIISFDTAAEAGAFLRDFIRAGDVVLVKGSQSMRMERVSKALLADQSRAADLLVRQDPEWLRR